MSTSLLFAAYTRDPLAAWLIGRRDWKAWQLASASVAVFCVFVAAGYMTYFVRDGRLDVTALGGYSAIAAANLFWFLVLAASSSFYVYGYRKAGTLFEELSRAQVLNGSDPELHRTVRGASGSVREIHGRVMWTVIAILIVLIIVGVSVNALALDPTRSDITKYRSLLNLIAMPMWAFLTYLVAMLVLRTLITIQGLYRVFRVGDVAVNPLHPDKCGGLRPVRDYALALSYLVTALGFALILVIFVMTRVEADDGTLTTNLGRLTDLPQALVGIGAYVVLGPLVFFGPLATAHGPMQTVKAKYLQRLSAQFKRDYESVHRHLSDTDMTHNAQFERIQHLHRLYRVTESFPVWPFDWGSVRRFATVYASPLVLPGVTIAIRVYLF